jgi:hypothetical protein
MHRIIIRRTNTDREPPKRVDFHANANDFRCVVLAAIGLTTVAIMKQTGLTFGQVEYRLRKAEEKERQRGKLSARRQYRMGVSPICGMVVSQMMSQRSTVKRAVIKNLDRHGLYEPRPNGVLNHKK